MKKEIIKKNEELKNAPQKSEQFFDENIVKNTTKVIKSKKIKSFKKLSLEKNSKTKDFFGLFKIKNKKEKSIKPIVRFNPELEKGLNEDEVKQRIAEKLTNKTKVKASKTYLSIFVKNIFTFFNMLWLLIAIALLCVGSYSDLLFMFVIVANTSIAIIQEIRAKVAVEKLSMVTTPQIKTLRNGKTVLIPADQLVLDDIIILSSGNQIPTDCKILSGKVEVNESLLTGESTAIEKDINAYLLSGSFIVSGECHAKVDKVGKDNYIEQMAQKAKEFKAPASNLFKDLNRLIKYIGIALVPIGILTFFKEYSLGGTLQTQITNTSGALTSMIPAGMFLLITIALAVGVVKLSKKNTLVRDLYSIEMLARTNVLCLDKTGTITDGTMKVVDFVTFSKKRTASIKKILSNILNAQKTSNSTSNAMIEEFGKDISWKVKNVIEFSSERKYSVTQFENKKIYFLGAVTKIGCSLTEQQKEFINDCQNKGLRIIALAETEGEFSKEITGKNSTLLAFVVIEEHIREDAVETIQWFKDNGVEIKIISGDSPATVSKIAQRVGVENSDKYVSLEGLSIKEVEQMADKFTVFGRVTPEQKYAIIKALKNKGKVVAMTGDGVNDTLALKEADCSIAMADGSEVARSISKLVLLKSNFSSLPNVVKEGRQVINNVQNSSSLFLMKTLFAITLTVITLFVQLAYPFTPKDMLLLESFVIGIPSFILTFEPNTKKIVGNFIPQVFKRAVPRALLMLLNVFIIMIIYYTQGDLLLLDAEYKTLCVLVLTYTGFLNLVTLCIPVTLVRGFAMGISFVGVTSLICAIPKLFSIGEGTFTVLMTFFAVIVFSILLIILIKLNRKRIEILRDKIIKLLQREETDE